MPDLPHVVIAGGGFAGLDAARAFDGAALRVTLVDRHNYHLFQPLLYQVATAALSPGDIASPIRWVLRKQRNVSVLLGEVRDIDVRGRRLHLNREAVLAYDYLILAAGSTHTYFRHPEWEAHAPSLKTLDDALEIRRQMLLAFEAAEREGDVPKRQRLLTFVIVGGGPTGVELAGALGEIARQTLRQDFRAIRPESARIVLVEGGPHLLESFPLSLSEAARRSLEQLGVEIRLGTLVTGIDSDGVSLGAERIPAETVLWAAGVAASPLAKALGVPLDRSGRIPCDRTLAVPDHPEIFVAGDLCFFEQDGRPLPGVAQVAKQQGAQAAKNVLHATRGEPLEPFRYRDYGSMATIGRGSAVAQIGWLNASGWFAWLLWLFIHVVSLIGFRNRVAVLSEWAWAYVTQQRRVRLITGGKLWPKH